MLRQRGLAAVLLAVSACGHQTTLKPDTTPPSYVVDLRATALTDTTLWLTWTSPGDDGARGTAAEYDVRYSTAAFDLSTWEETPRLHPAPVPRPAGDPESLLVGGLTPGVTNFFALRTADEVPNWSAISNLTAIPTFPEPPPAFDLSWGGSGNANGEFDSPLDAAAGNGRIYIADANNHRIQVFDYSGHFLLKWGRASAVEPVSFGLPADVAVDQAGYLYVTSTRPAVLKCDAQGNVLEQWSEGRESIAIDSKGQIYLAGGALNDTKVVVLDSGGSRLREWGSSGTGDGQFRGLLGIAIDADDYVYVTDSWNHKVQKFETDGTFVLSWGRLGADPGEFSEPKAIACGRNGTVYIGDTGNYRVQMFDSEGAFLGEWGSPGAGAGEFSRISGLAVAASGDVYVSDSSRDRVQVFSMDGVYRRTFGLPERCEGRLHDPVGLAVSMDGRVYVADDFRVAVYDGTGQFVESWPEVQREPDVLSRKFHLTWSPGDTVTVADGGYGRFQRFGADGGLGDVWSLGTLAYLHSNPGAVAAARNGDLAAVNGYFISRYSPSGKCLPGITGVLYYNFSSVAFDGQNNLWTLDMRPRISRYVDGALVGSWGTAGAAPGYLDQPGDLTVTAEGKILIADTGRDRVQMFTRSGHLLTAWGRTGNRPGEFKNPGGVTVDENGAVYVVDTGNNRIQKFVW